MAEHIRWYPEATKLEDGRVLILSGWEMPLYGPAPNGPWTVGASHVTAEIYDPATGAYEPLTGASRRPPCGTDKRRRSRSPAMSATSC